MHPLVDVDADVDVEATMRDGTVLRADVYRPSSKGPWPVLLVRTPYNKQDPDILALLDPQAATRRGYLVVIQDTRGRYRSAGQWIPLIHERVDGYDTVRWAARLPGADGRVGMYGPSYLGHVQWAALSAKPPELVAAVPAFTWSDPDDGLVARGGARELGLLTQWSQTVGYDLLSRSVDARALPQIADGLVGLAAPTLTVAGWYDAFLQGSLDNYVGARDSGQPAALIVGPWSHGNQSSRIGEIDFGAGADAGSIDGGSSLRSLELDWLDRYLKVKLKPDEVGAATQAPVLIFVMGVNEWRRLENWPPAAVEVSWYLRADGVLSKSYPKAGEAVRTYRHDSANPVPTRGGALLLTDQYPAGPFDQCDVEGRRDVLVYTSEALKAPLEVIGRVRAEIVVGAVGATIDLVVRLCDVDTEGVSRNITDGVLRVSHGDVGPREHCIDLWSTAHVFQVGHRLRVHVTSSNFPRWDLLPAADLSVHHDAARPSRIVLPVHIGGGAARGEGQD